MCWASSGQGTFCEGNWGLEELKIVCTITMSSTEKLFLNSLARNDLQEMTYKKWTRIFWLKFSNPVKFTYIESPHTSFEHALHTCLCISMLACCASMKLSVLHEWSPIIVGDDTDVILTTQGDLMALKITTKTMDRNVIWWKIKLLCSLKVPDL